MNGEQAASTSGQAGTVARDLALLLGIALLYRLVFLLLLRPVVDTADAVHYLAMAEAFSRGDFAGYDSNLPILYPLLGAACTWIVRDTESACRIVSMIGSTLLVVPLYVLASSMHGRRCAFLAAFLAAIWPWLADYACRIGPESLAVTLWFAGVVLLARALRRGGAALLLAPIAFFALYLTRPEGAILMFAAPVLALILTRGAGDARYRRIVPYLLTLALLVALYTLFMKLQTGRGAIVYRAPGSGDLWDYLARGSVPLVETYLAVTGNALPVMLGPLMLLFAGVGFFHRAGRVRDARLELFVLAFCAVQVAVTLANFSPAPRYLMPIIVAISIWSARGLAIVTDDAARLPNGRVLRVLPIAVTVLFMLQGTVVTLGAEFVGRVPRQPREYKITGRWMKENLEPGVILTRKPQVGFYAGMPTTGPAADDTPDSLLARAKLSGARYLVVDERYTANEIPALRALLDPTQAPPFLDPLRDDLSPYRGARVVVYRISHPSLSYTDPAAFAAPRSYAGPEENR